MSETSEDPRDLINDHSDGCGRVIQRLSPVCITSQDQHDMLPISPAILLLKSDAFPYETKK